MWRERLIVILTIPADVPNHQGHPRVPAPGEPSDDCIPEHPAPDELSE